MKISTAVRDWAILLALIVGPVLVALAIRVIWGPSPWRPVSPLVGLSALAAISGYLLVDRAGRLQRRRTGRPPDTDFSPREFVLAAVGAACFVAAVLLVVAAVDFRAYVVFIGLALAWVLVWTPRASREVVIRSTIEVQSTPHAAFELVSNPNHWPRYIPQAELAQPVDVPVRLGTVIHDRVRRGGEIVVLAEEVVVYEPGRRFGTTVLNDPMRGTGTYEFEAVATGTRIEHTSRFCIPLHLAIVGGRIAVREETKNISAGRTQAMQAIKKLLEEPSSDSV